jgi:hypothetical protein
LPLLTAALILAAVPLLWRSRAVAGRSFALGFLLAWVVLVGATVDFGGEAWLWPRSFLRVPGAEAVRELTRVLAITAPFAAIACVIPLQALWRAGPGLRLLAVALLPLLPAEQWTALPDGGLRRAEEARRFAALSRAPAGCAAFVATVPRAGRSRSATDELYSHNVDAMLLASLTGLRTVNGFSTFNPPGWDFAAPNRPDYAARVSAYALGQDIGEPLCGVDFARLRWSGPGEPWAAEVAAPLDAGAAVGAPLPVGGNRDAAGWLASGFHALEPWGVWSAADARMVLPLPVGWTGGGRIVLTVQRFAAGPGQPPAVLTVAGQPPLAVTFDDGQPRRIALPFDAATGRAGSLQVAIHDPRAVSPTAIGAGQDRRVLGIGLLAVELQHD